MNTVHLVLPSALLLYFLWRSLRQRVFLLGLPFLMDMNDSVFFNRLTLFWVPGQWAVADRIMLWFLVTWIIYFDLILPGRRRSVRARHIFGPRLSAIEEVVLVGFAAYMLLRVATTAVHFMDLGTALGEARGPLYAFAGYFLLRGILCHAGRKETVDLLAAIVVVNTIAAGLYVLHQGLHLPIYGGTVEYEYIVYNGELLTRSFYFMPQYLPLAIAFCAAKRKWSLLWVGVLVVTLAALWVSYTRSLVLVAVVEIVVILAVRLLKQRDAWPAAKRVLQIILVIGVFVGAAGILLPTQSAYLFSRIAETQSAGSALEAGTMQIRLDWWRTTYQWVGDNSILGVGFPSARQDARVTRVGVMAPDLVWVPTVWTLGLIGVASLAGLFIAFAWRATSLSLASEGDAAFLSTVLLGVVVGVFLLGFVEWTTIFSPWHTPLGLSFFALLAAERCRQRAEARQTVTDAGDRSIVPESVGSG
jgi:hypothetical protein